MERPERPSRHKLNRVKVPFRPTFSSDSESEVNDNDVPIHITYYESQGDCNVSGGPSTSSSVQLLGQSGNADTPTNNMNDFVPTANIGISPASLAPVALLPSEREEESRGEPQTHLDSIRRKRPAASSLPSSSVLFDGVDPAYNSSTSGPHSPTERPVDRSHRGDYKIRTRSFCHIDALRPPVFKFKRLNGPIDLTPTTSNRESSSKGPVTSSIFGVRDNLSLHSSPDLGQTQNCLPILKRVSNSTLYGMPPRSDTATSSSILRHFDEMCPSSATVSATRTRLKPTTSYTFRFLDSLGRANDSTIPEASSSASINSRNSTLDDYCDLVNNFFFTGSAIDSNSQRSPERGVNNAEQQARATADIINRHIGEGSSITNDLNTYLDPPQPMRNGIEGGTEPMDRGSDDVIVVENLDHTIPESFIVPSSRSPSPSPQPQTPSAAPIPATNKPEKTPVSVAKEVPMTLQELNQSLVSLLECPVCLDHATPPIYQCCKGHILCRSCHPRLTTCPICRSRLPGDRNSVMEKVAEKLMYPCKNTVTGCSQMLKLDDKQKHEEGCGFRHYTCIITECHWKGYKPELVVHLQSNHPDKLITGAVKELHVPVPTSVPDGSPMLITHHWIQSAHNEVFIVTFNIDLYKRVMKGCIIYIGSPEKAEKFTYVFELKQRVSPFRRLSYSRTTHADTFKPGQPLCLSNDFSINIDIARLYHDYVSHAIPVHISIVQSSVPQQ